MNKKAYVSRTFMKIWRFIHKENRSVVFKSFDNQFSDNPRFIAERLYERNKDNNKKIKMYWIVNDKNACKEHFPAYIELIDDKSLKKFKVVASSKVWVDNCTKNSTQYKANDQFYVQTWHGDRGFKKIGKLANKLPEDFENAPKFDLAVAGSDYGENKYKKAFGYSGQIIKKGCPRNDILINQNEEFCDNVKNKLGIGKNVKVFLYAPTFRDDKKGKKQNFNGLDIKKTLSCLEAKTKNKWVCLLRTHHLVSDGFDMENKNDCIKDVSAYDDITDLMAIADFMITDYSSCAGDFILTDKPLVLYHGDEEEYKKNSRGFMFEIKDSPYFVAHDQNELEKHINNLDENNIKENCKKIREFYGCYETGRSSDYICEIIENKLR